jgi:retinol dehydrogenase 12
VSSVAHRFGTIKNDDLNSEKSYNRVNCYSQSKLANILFTRELAKRLKGSRVTVNALHPGNVNTELSRDIDKMTFLFNKYLVKTFLILFFKTAKAGAQTSVYAGLKTFFHETVGFINFLFFCCSY